MANYRYNAVLPEDCDPRSAPPCESELALCRSCATHYAELWYAAFTATPTKAQPMTTIDAFRQDAWTRQAPRLSNDWSALPQSPTATTPSAPTMPAQTAPPSGRWIAVRRSIAHNANGTATCRYRPQRNNTPEL